MIFRLNIGEVFENIRKLGYGIDNRPGCKFGLTVRSKRKLKKNPDQVMYEGIGGYPKEEWRKLSARCDDPAMAARIIVAYCTGAEAPAFEPEKPSAMTPAEIAAMVQLEVSKKLHELGVDPDGLRTLQAAKQARKVRGQQSETT